MPDDEPITPAEDPRIIAIREYVRELEQAQDVAHHPISATRSWTR